MLKSFSRIAEWNPSLQGAVEVFLSEVSLGELLKEINKMESSKLPRPDSFLPRVPQEIKYEHSKYEM